MIAQSYWAQAGLLVGAESVPDYQRLTAADYEAAYSQAAKAQADVFAAILSHEGAPTYANTINAFLQAADRTENVLANLFAHVIAESSDERDTLKTKLLNIASQQQADFMQNPEFAAKAQVVNDNRDMLGAKEQHILKKFMDGFQAYGTLLDPAAQSRIKALDTQLNDLTSQFMKNLKEARIANAVYIDDVSKLEGIAPSDIATFAAQAQEKGYNSGYLIVPERLMIDKLLSECANRDTRKALYEALTTIGADATRNGTEGLVHAIADARAERAAICGYATYADSVLDGRMLGSVDRLNEFLAELTSHLLPHYAGEVATVTGYAQAHGHAGKLEPWDIDYWTAQYKEETFQMDMAALTPYLHTNNVLDGLLNHMADLYQVSFTAAPDLPKVHPDILPYRVYDKENGTLLSVVMVDLYARPDTKNGGAWAATFRKIAQDADGTMLPPIVGLQMNLNKPQNGLPSIIDHGNIETLFHEMGHVMHAVLGQNQPVNMVRGTAVQKDFVEMPSQVLENFVNEPAFMATFLKHADTGAPPPAEALEQLAEYAKFGRAQSLLKIAQNSMYDLAMHTTPARRAGTLAQIMERETISADISPLVRPYQLTRFDHLFSSASAYAVGYYSYAWSDVLDAQAYASIKADPVQGPASLKATLQAGGSEDATQLFTRMFGEIDVKHALRRAGVQFTDAPEAVANAGPDVSAAADAVPPMRNCWVPVTYKGPGGVG